MNVEFLIVGQGLAGSLLGWALARRGQRVFVIDHRTPDSASRVAAGLINPVSGQRLVKSTDVDACLPTARRYYQQLADTFGRTFFHASPMLRLFRSRAEQDRYKNRARDPAYEPYLGDSFEPGQSGQPVNDPLGGFAQRQTGYLAIPALLDVLQHYFAERNAYCEAPPDYTRFHLTSSGVKWNGVEARQVIFCDGANAVNNPWFRWLPFQLSKGEVVAIQTAQELPGCIVNDGQWLLPLDRHNARLGATYHWQWSEDQPTAADAEMLMASYQRMTGVDETAIVTGHLAGIRPATKDKQPFIGLHPERHQLGIFNGFGSKGAMLIPYYCERFIEHLLDDVSLPAMVDIARFEHSMSMVTLARRHVCERIKQGDTVIDATVGNGHDSEFLARCVGEEGRVLGFDIQPQALAKTRETLKGKGLAKRAILYNVSHEHMCHTVPVTYQQQVSVVMFNLGYLPGANKNVVTRTDSTVSALNSALKLLQGDGVLSVVFYRGHGQGDLEYKAVAEWVSGLDHGNFSSQWFRQSSQTTNPSPVLVLIRKKTVSSA
ncbi:MAG: FAD-dependent oxidoreductase [Gammaproteobacteria bacterium]|jgi:glycine/D-amino acid oxidase-like deaminating enzyme/23S rRNA U2552 (ribose-2'-O)-methylase RlmE/FtsJ